MNELLKGATGSRRVYAITVGWLAPILIGYFMFVVFVLPEVRGSWLINKVAAGATALSVNRFLFSLVLCIAIASVAYLNRSFLHLLLQGEKWPRVLRDWRRSTGHLPHQRYVRAKQQAHRAEQALARAQQERAAATPQQRARLQEQVKRAQRELERAVERRDAADQLRHRRGRAHDSWLPRRRRPLFTPRDVDPTDGDWIPAYPTDEDDVMATRFGNEMKAIETFGSSTYGLDSQTLWYELYSDAPDALRETLDDAELQTDTFVCLLYVSAAFAASAFGGVLWRLSDGEPVAELTLVGLVAAAALPVVYRGLLSAAREWGLTIQALVTTGRLRLRTKYGLRAPSNFEEERAMWEALTGFVYYGGDPHYAQQLDVFRSADTSSKELEAGPA